MRRLRGVDSQPAHKNFPPIRSTLYTLLGAAEETVYCIFTGVHSERTKKFKKSSTKSRVLIITGCGSKKHCNPPHFSDAIEGACVQGKVYPKRYNLAIMKRRQASSSSQHGLIIIRTEATTTCVRLATMDENASAALQCCKYIYRKQTGFKHCISPGPSTTVLIIHFNFVNATVSLGLCRILNHSNLRSVPAYASQNCIS